MTTSKTLSRQDIWFAFFFYILLIAVGGYVVGINDQAEFLPYALYIHDPSLYPHDLYIQGMEAMHINERYFFARLMALFFPVLEPATFLFHFIFTMLLITGFLKFSGRYIENRFLRYAVVFLILIVTDGITLGGNELYYNNFQGATIAKALCAWGLSFLVERKYVWLSVVTIISTLFQPMVGFQFFILTSVAVFYGIVIEKQIKPIVLLWYVIAFALTGGLFIWGIKSAQAKEVLTTITDREFIDAAYYFCMPFHFVPSYFSKKGIILMTILFVAGVYFYSKKERSILVILLTIFLGMIVYVAGTYLYESFFIMSSWWFRTSIWIKVTGFAAALALVGIYFKIGKYTAYESAERRFFIITGILLVVLIAKFPDRLPFNKEYHLLGHASHYPAVEICEQIKDRVPKDAVFIQPMYFSALKYYGEKSSYVEFLTPARRRDYLKIWNQRIHEVYNIGIEDIPENTYMLKGIQIRENLMQLGEENYRKHAKQSLMLLKAKGVTHMITFKDHLIEGLKIIAENKKYKVYEL